MKKIISPLVLLAFLILLSMTCNLTAHEQVNLQIKNVSQQLKSKPDDADLLLRRSTLWYEQGELEKALQDTKQVLQQKPESMSALLLLGKLKKDQQDYLDAIQIANQLVELFPKQAQGYLLRARILQNMTNKEVAASDDYATAMGLLEHPRPELFLEQVNMQLKQKQGITLALKQLATARERYGFLYVLQKKAFDIARDDKRLSITMNLAQDITHHMQRKEQWLKIQGMLFEENGDNKAADKKYRAAQVAIQQLPQRLQNHPKMLSLKQELALLLQANESKNK